MTNKDWIPINEKLPLNKEYVLVTTKDGVVAQAEFFSAGWLEIYVKRSIYVLDIDDTLAWMPMPKPYKAESEDKE